MAFTYSGSIHAKVAGDTSGSGLATAGMTTTGATLLVAVVADYSPTDAGAAFSDSFGNAWVATAFHDEVVEPKQRGYYCVNPTVGGSHTFRFTTTANAFATIVVAGFGGTPDTSPLDVQTGATVSTGTTLSTGSITPSADNELIIAFLSSGPSSSTYSINSGFTLVDSADYVGGTSEGGALAYKIQTTAAAVNPQWSWSGSSRAAVGIASFKLAAGAPITTGGQKPTVVVEVELSGLGAGWTNLGAGGSVDVVSAAGVIIRRGISQGGPGDLVASTGTASFTLDNSASNSGAKLGYYSLFHANKRTGWALGIGCRIRLVDPATSTSRTRFVGRIDAIDPLPGKNRERYVRVTAVDWLDEAARWALTPDIGQLVGKRGDQVMTAILAAMPAQPTATSFDVGAEAYPYALDTSSPTHQPALAEFGKIALSGFDLIYVTATGTLRYEGRHTRLIHTATDWTLTESDIVGLTLPSTRDDIINTVRTTAHPKVVDEFATTVVYSQANPISVMAGATKFLLGPYRNPVTGDLIGAADIQTQVAGTDYIANTTDTATGTDLTSSFSITVTDGPSGAAFSVTNSSGSNGFLTTNQLLGKGIYDIGTVTAEASDTTSVTANGEHAVAFDMAYQSNDNVAQGAANYLLAKYKDVFAQAKTVTVAARTSTLLTQVLQRDISDRLAISETVTGVNGGFFINGEELRVLPTGQVVVTYTLAPAADPASGTYFIVGTSALASAALLAPF